MLSASRKRIVVTVLSWLTLGLLQIFHAARVTRPFDKSRTSGSAQLETEGVVKVKHQVSNPTNNLRSRVVDNDVPGEKDKTVSEEITEGAVKVEHQVSNATTNLRSRVVDDDVPGEKDETVSEEITEGAVKVKHQASNLANNLRSRAADDDVQGENDETALEEIIHMPPKAHHLKLPRAGSKEGESSSMIDSMVCACAKCGSSSLYRSLYKIAFGEDWPYSGPPWPHDLTSHRWKGVADVALTDLSDILKQNSFALIRDPKDRLLSAFRSKVTCDNNHGVNIPDRKRLVPELLELAGFHPPERYGLQPHNSEDAGLCLNRTTYLQALGEVLRSGREAELDGHFRPQTSSCFLNLPPSKWKVVTTIDRPGAYCDLESVVRGAVTSMNGTAAMDPEDCSFMKSHGSKKTDNSTLSEEEEMLLEEITRKEYEVLGPYL